MIERISYAIYYKLNILVKNDVCPYLIGGRSVINAFPVFVVKAHAFGVFYGSVKFILKIIGLNFTFWLQLQIPQGADDHHAQIYILNHISFEVKLHALFNDFDYLWNLNRFLILLLNGFPTDSLVVLRQIDELIVRLHVVLRMFYHEVAFFQIC